MRIPDYFEFHNSVKLLSGFKAISHIPFELKNLNSERPLILTDQTIKKLGLADKVLNAFDGSGIVPVAIFDDIPADAPLNKINEVAKFYRDNNCDSLIAVGGGSVIDSAKGVNILVSSDSDNLMDFVGLDKVSGKLRPFIAVPTTSGTGSEATLVAVITDTERHIKMEFISYNMLPDVAVLDPEMTESLPPHITAATGMDALVHAIEAYSGRQKNPISDVHASAAIKIIAENLIPVVKNGRDKKARLAMANASFMAGAAFSNSMVSLTHAIGHAVGAVSHVPHGVAMSILLPWCMKHNLKMAESSYAEVLTFLKKIEDVVALSEKERAQACINYIEDLLVELNKICKLPVKLGDAGVKKEDFDEIVARAINDGAVVPNPEFVDETIIKEILEKAF
ncbi:MAG: iron-containing alcohol dehydrogenase [Spirochaetales bacterium]|nr:iron-containing alcohol dehydrogenase [Spirochaetales bacterium]